MASYPPPPAYFTNPTSVPEITSIPTYHLLSQPPQPQIGALQSPDLVYASYNPNNKQATTSTSYNGNTPPATITITNTNNPTNVNTATATATAAAIRRPSAGSDLFLSLILGGIAAVGIYGLLDRWGGAYAPVLRYVLGFVAAVAGLSALWHFVRGLARVGLRARRGDEVMRGQRDQVGGSFC